MSENLKFRLKLLPTSKTMELWNQERKRREKVALDRRMIMNRLELEIQSLQNAMSLNPGISTGQIMKMRKDQRMRLKKLQRRYSQLKESLQLLDPSGVTVVQGKKGVLMQNNHKWTVRPRPPYQ